MRGIRGRVVLARGSGIARDGHIHPPLHPQPGMPTRGKAGKRTTIGPRRVAVSGQRQSAHVRVQRAIARYIDIRDARGGDVHRAPAIPRSPSPPLHPCAGMPTRGETRKRAMVSPGCVTLDTAAFGRRAIYLGRGSHEGGTYLAGRHRVHGGAAFCVDSRQRRRQRQSTVDTPRRVASHRSIA